MLYILRDRKGDNEKGMYTGLRIKVTVKKDFYEMINEINNEEADFCDYVDQFPFLTNFTKLKRSEQIPSGISAYLPNDWEEGEYPNERPTDGFERKFDIETGSWTFQCSLKNYDGVIEYFFNDVLANIIQSADHIESKQECEESILYQFINGEITRIDKFKCNKISQRNSLLFKGIGDFINKFFK